VRFRCGRGTELCHVAMQAEVDGIAQCPTAVSLLSCSGEFREGGGGQLQEFDECLGLGVTVAPLRGRGVLSEGELAGGHPLGCIDGRDVVVQCTMVGDTGDRGDGGEGWGRGVSRWGRRGAAVCGWESVDRWSVSAGRWLRRRVERGRGG